MTRTELSCECVFIFEFGNDQLYILLVLLLLLLLPVHRLRSYLEAIVLRAINIGPTSRSRGIYTVICRDSVTLPYSTSVYLSNRIDNCRGRSSIRLEYSLPASPTRRTASRRHFSATCQLCHPPMQLFLPGPVSSMTSSCVLTYPLPCCYFGTPPPQERLLRRWGCRASISSNRAAIWHLKRTSYVC